MRTFSLTLVALLTALATNREARAADEGASVSCDETTDPSNRHCDKLQPAGDKATFRLKNCPSPSAPSADQNGEATLSCTAAASTTPPSTAVVSCSGVSQLQPNTDLSLQVECGTQTVRTTVKVGATADEGGDAKSDKALATVNDHVWRRVMREVGIPLAGIKVGNYYDRAGDIAVLFFDADGHPYFPMPDTIDEDDDVYVIVMDTPERMAKVSLRSEGCKRPPVEARVAGRDLARLKAKETTLRTPFIVRALGKCAGSDTGGPQLTFSREGGVPQKQIIPINSLYHLAIGVAAAYDNTRQRDFALNTLPGETVPRVAQFREPIGLTSLTYISYYPIARDFRKKDFILAQRAQLFIGLDPRAFDKHLVAGVGYELTAGLNLLLGWRLVTKQKILEEGSGLTPGALYDGKPKALPTRERWEFGGWFIGAGLSSSLLARLR